MKSHFFPATALLAMATLATPALAEDFVNPEATSCGKTLLGMQADAIDGVAFFAPATPADDGNPIMRNSTLLVQIGIPQARLADINKRDLPAWFAFHFRATPPVLAGFAVGGTGPNATLNGLVLNLVYATPKKCVVADDIIVPQDRMNHMLLANMSINQQAIQPDGTYRNLTADEKQQTLAFSDDNLRIRINAFLTKKIRDNFTKYFKP